MGSLKYPLKRFDEQTPFVKISALTKIPTPLITDFNGQVQAGNRSGQKPLMTWFLPLPEGINDRNGAEWGSGSLNKLEQVAASTGLDMMNSTGVSDFLTKGKEALEAGGGYLASSAELQSSIQKQLASEILKSFGSKGGNLLSRTEGKVLNPYLELLYDGPQLRDFSYSFQFNPRSQKENETVKRIINRFKFHMSANTDVSRGNRGWFVESPDVFNVEFMLGSKKHPYLNSLKTSALVDMSVNYTEPSQNNATFYDDGGPVGYRLDLQFRELEPIYKEDYDVFSDDNLSKGVGY
jgi:hypothetical protein